MTMVLREILGCDVIGGLLLEAFRVSRVRSARARTSGWSHHEEHQRKSWVGWRTTIGASPPGDPLPRAVIERVGDLLGAPTEFFEPNTP